MNDKQFTLFAVVIAVALFVWYIITKRQQVATETPGEQAGAFPSGNWPMTSVPGETFLPPSLGSIEMNISNPGFNLLSNQYIPMFGFVGMAQGSRYGG